MIERDVETAPFRVLEDGASPAADTPPGLGTKLVKAAGPHIPAERVADLELLAKILDAAPGLARSARDAMTGDPSASTAAGVRPKPRQRRAGDRWPIVLATVSISFTLAGILVVGAAMWSISTRMARNEGETEAVRRQDDERASSTKDKLEAQATKLAAHDEQISMLTELMLGRTTALGIITGADQLTEWTPVPTDLSIIELQAKRDRERAGD